MNTTIFYSLDITILSTIKLVNLISSSMLEPFISAIYRWYFILRLCILIYLLQNYIMLCCYSRKLMFEKLKLYFSLLTKLLCKKCCEIFDPPLLVTTLTDHSLIYNDLIKFEHIKFIM